MNSILKIIGFIVISTCPILINAQNMFEEFKANKQLLDAGDNWNSSELKGMIRKQDDLLLLIEKRNLDSFFVYYPQAILSICMLTVEKGYYPIDSLDKYSQQLLVWSQRVKDTTNYVRSILCRSIVDSHKGNKKTLRLFAWASILARHSGDTKIVSIVASNHINSTVTFGDFNKAVELVHVYLPYSESFEDQKKSSFYTAVGYAYGQLNNFTESYFFLNKAVDVALKSKDSLSLLHVYSQYSGLFIAMGELDKALNILQEVLKIYDRLQPIHDPTLSYFIYTNFVNYYDQIGPKDSLDKYMELALIDRIKWSDSSNIMSVKLQKGLNNIKNGQYEPALKLFQEVLKYDVNHGLQDWVGYLYYCMARCYRLLENYDLAFFYGEKGIHHYKMAKDYASLAACYAEMHKMFKRQRDFKQALYYNELRLKYTDSTFHQEKAAELAKQETQFNVKITEYEKEQYRLETEKQKALNLQKDVIIEKKRIILKKEARVRQFLIVSIVSSVFAMVLLVTVFFIRNRSKKRLLALKDVTIEKQQLDQRVLTDKLKYLKGQLIRESKTGLSDTKAESVKVKSKRSLAKQIKQDNNWLDFLNDFNATYNGFLDKLKGKYPALSNNDIRVACLTKLGLTLKEQAELLVVSNAGITKAKTRLRDRLGLNHSSDIPVFMDKFIEQYCQG